MSCTIHPLDPLTPEEISKVVYTWSFQTTTMKLIQEQAADVVRPLFNNMIFRVITLKEPPKDDLVKYLEAEHRADDARPSLSRCARVEVLVKNSKGTTDLWELVVDVDHGAVINRQHLEGKHSYIDSVYMKEVEEACLADAKVQAEIETLDLPGDATVIVEPWAYATDGANDMSRRISMVLPMPSHSSTRGY